MAADHDYLRIRPTDDPLPADRITGQFEQLHQALDAPVEWLLVADDEIAYYAGTRPRARDTLARILDRLTPDSYRIERVDTDPMPDLDGPPVAAELHGRGDRTDDWQTRLRPPAFTDAPEQHDTARVEAAPGLPLESIVQGLTDADATVVYQTLLTPKPDWSGDAEYRIRRIDDHRDTLGQRLYTFLFGSVDTDDDRHSPRRSEHRRGDAGSVPGTRIDAILAKSERHCFDVNARLLAGGPDAEPVVRDLAAAFSAVGGDFYEITATTHTDAAELHERVADAATTEPDALRDDLTRRLPLVGTESPRIVADSTTVPHFCLLDGASLTDSARRALRAPPAERTGTTPPDADKLDYYETGMPLGHPLDADGSTLSQTVALPPQLQPLHVAWFGRTGSGKSTALTNAILENHAATDGADILIDPKGDGMPVEYLRAHYAEYGTLENVYYFDCSEYVPAVSFFDIRDQLAAGVSRTTAVQNVVDHYLEILRGVMAEENFDEAVRSPDVIQYLVKALFDPEYGADAFTHRDLQRAARRLREEGQPPQVSDDDLQGMLAGVTANDDRSFEMIMQGVANRIEKIPVDDRLARVFNHQPDDDAPAFDLRRVLDEDAVVIVDLGGLRTRSQRALALVMLSTLWTALQRRAQASTDPPLVNLYLEEAATLAVSELVTDLLSQARGFGLSVTLAMQFPGQLREVAPRTYDELMNNVGSVLTGNVAADTQLQQRLATEAMPADEVGNRLRALSRGEWMASLPAPFGEPRPQPFVMASLPLPAGHPESDTPLSDAREAAFGELFDDVQDRTRRNHGLAVDEAADTDTRTETTASEAGQPGQTDGTLPPTLQLTDRFPNCIDVNEPAGALECGNCGSRHPPSSEGIRNAIDCCASLDRVDRDEIPVCDVSLQLSPGEVADSDYDVGQLLFLQLVYDAGHQRFDPTIEYDLCRDSMVRLREYAGLDPEAVEQLCEDGLLRQDCERPFTLYTVTPAGRDEIEVAHAGGVGHGDGVGDLGESTHHRLMVLYGHQLVQESFVADPDSSAETARMYHQVGNERLDVAGLDADGDVVVALEAERNTNDTARAVLDDFDTMADCAPAAAIWLCDGRATAHDVLDALNDPLVGPQRVEKSYSRNTAPTRVSIDTAGLTEMRTLSGVIDAVDERPSATE
ncbi:type IV secretory system conjugative DNA transfer family protein [Halorarius halobius]|uniref:type IV secretory system conjugative DNA transfer family protein n=1 Tax=Halorarius halobius TaxID=2962671 RepID=UPI0020CE3136|nr:hypothetical protein [Halorarius halobius]